MKIEISIPIYNEEKRLEAGLAALHQFCVERKLDFHITLADNGSVDGTAAIAERLCGQFSNVGLIRVGKKGVGRALKAAWDQSNADIVGYTDVDLSTDLIHTLDVIEALTSGKAEVINGSRLLPGSIVIGRPLIRSISSNVFNFLLKMLLQTKLTDGMCGFKFALNRVYKDLRRRGLVSDGWFFNAELIIKAEWAGYRVLEIPVKWSDDPNSKVKILPLTIAYLKEIFRMRAERRAWQI